MEYVINNEELKELLDTFDSTSTLFFNKNTIKKVNKLDNGKVKAYFCNIYNLYSGESRWFILAGSLINQTPTDSFLNRDNYKLPRKNYNLALKECENGKLTNDFEIRNGSKSQCYSIILGTPSSQDHAQNHLYNLSEDERNTLLSTRSKIGADKFTLKGDIEAMNHEDAVSIEGAKLEKKSIVYERDPNLKKIALKIHGISCKVCGFNFEQFYGEIGVDFIEVHHLEPLSLRENPYETVPERDLIPICSNCHRMIHRKRDKVLSIDELKLEIENNKEKIAKSGKG